MWNPSGPFGTGPINVNTRPDPSQPARRSNSSTTWWGIGQELTGHLVVGGKQMLHGQLMCCGDPSRVAEFHAQQFRLCLGLGGSWSTVALLGINIASSLDLKTALTERDMGLALAAGVNTKAYLEAFRVLRPFAAAVEEAGSLKMGLRALAGWERAGNMVENAMDLHDAIAYGKPQLLAVPYGVGLELAIYASVSTEILLLNWTDASR